MGMVPFALASAGAALACPDPVGSAALAAALDGAEAHLARLDIPAFRAETDRLAGLLPCLTEVAEPALAARLHRILGVRAFGERDPAASRYFAAARTIEPGYVFPESLIPRGTPVRTEYEAIGLQERQVEIVPTPAEGRIVLDGVLSLERPVDWPTLVQFVTAPTDEEVEEQVTRTAYLKPDDPMPTYDVWTGSQPPPAYATGPARGTARHAATIGVTSTAGAATVALYALALSSEARYKDTDGRPLPDSQLDGVKARTNTLGVAAAVAGVLTLAGGVTVVVTW